MERQEIFEKISAIVAQELSINEECINEETQLFEVELVDRRYGLKGKRVIDFKPEESQYYGRKLSIFQGDNVNATNVLIALEEEFEIEISDEIASSLTTIELAVDYISTVVTDPTSQREQ